MIIFSYYFMNKQHKTARGDNINVSHVSHVVRSDNAHYFSTLPKKTYKTSPFDDKSNDDEDEEGSNKNGPGNRTGPDPCQSSGRDRRRRRRRRRR